MVAVVLMASQCTYRCVVLPDGAFIESRTQRPRLNEPFSPEPMAQGPGSARWCGKNGCGAGVARTGAAHLVLPWTFPRHHADPGQSGVFLVRRAQCTYRCVVLPDAW